MKGSAFTAEEEAESLLPTRRSLRITQRRPHGVSLPLQGVPTHLPAGAYMTTQALNLPPLSLPSASLPHTCEQQDPSYILDSQLILRTVPACDSSLQEQRGIALQRGAQLWMLVCHTRKSSLASGLPAGFAATCAACMPNAAERLCRWVRRGGRMRTECRFAATVSWGAMAATQLS